MASGSAGSGRLYSVQVVPGKGLGLVALCDIPRGTHIFSEAPFLLFPKQRTQQIGWEAAALHAISRLSGIDRDDFHALHNQFDGLMPHALGIFRTNAVAVGGPPLPFVVIGGTAARLNHSCIANARLSWNPHADRQDLFAKREIKGGEEITVSYMSEGLAASEIRSNLQEFFNFDCKCPNCCPASQLNVCKDSPVTSHGVLGRDAFPGNESIKGGSQLADGLKGDDALSNAAPQESDVTDDNMKQPTDTPARPSFPPAQGNKGSAVTIDVPLAFGPAMDAQVFLQKAILPAHRHSFNSFRDNYMFPTFHDLPWEDSVDEDHYVRDEQGWRPRRNWIFLCQVLCGEVDMSDEDVACVDVLVKDKNGYMSRIVFPVDCPAAEANLNNLELGCTLALVCPDRVTFSDGTVGTRVLGAGTLRVFQKRTLDEMLLLSDKIQAFSPNPANPARRCQNCSRHWPFMRQCGDCRMFWYCTTLCACVACAEDDHVVECRVMRRPDFQFFVRMRNEFRGWPEFTAA